MAFVADFPRDRSLPVADVRKRGIRVVACSQGGRATWLLRWEAAAATVAITMLAAACGSSGATAGNSAPSATASHSASSPAQPAKASTEMCQDNAALQASLASLAQVSTGKGALKQVKADLQDAQAKLSTLTDDAHGTFSSQINALKSVLTTLQTTVKGVSSGSSSAADVRTAFDGVTTATGDLSTALSQGGCSSVG